MIACKKPQKGKVINVTPMAIKLGQKDTLQTPSFRLEFTTTNNELEQLAPGLREALFTKASTAPSDVKARQQAIDGVDEVSDLPSLSIIGQRLGTFDWNHEQTGCAFTVIFGTGRKDSNVKMEGCTAKKWQLTPQEGGSIKVRVTINGSGTDELDDTTTGKLYKLKKRSIEFTLEGPKVDTSQRVLQDEEQDLGGPTDATTAFLASAGQPALSH